MLVRTLPKYALVLLYAMYFCAGFVIVFKVVSPYIEKKNTESVEKNPPSYFEVLAFATKDVRIVNLGELEEFKRRNPEYSFLIPENTEKEYAEMLERKNKGVKFIIEVWRIEPGKQIISVSSDDFRSDIVQKYEAIDKEVFPKTYTHQNMRDTFFKFLPSAVGGLITCLIFFVFYRKYIIK
jgi:hypothetical protein